MNIFLQTGRSNSGITRYNAEQDLCFFCAARGHNLIISNNPCDVEQHLVYKTQVKKTIHRELNLLIGDIKDANVVVFIGGDDLDHYREVYKYCKANHIFTLLVGVCGAATELLLEENYEETKFWDAQKDDSCYSMLYREWIKG